MDNNIHFLIVIYNATFSQECWPKAYGTFPDLQLAPTLTPTACAQVPSGPNPRLPTSADAVVHLEPGRTTLKPFTDIDAFAKVAGVEHITLVFDGRMDLCLEYEQYNMTDRDLYPCDSSPDLRNISANKLDALALEVSAVACSNPLVTGVQIDLEPLKYPWRKSTIDAIGKMAAALQNGKGCVDKDHPNGRFISTFTFAESVTDDLLTALGTNGVLAVSGYDLYPDNVDTRFNTPAEYGKKLQKQVEATIAITGGVQGVSGVDPVCRIPWLLGLPVAASAHEYKTYTPNPAHCGPACTLYNNPADMADYVKAAFAFVRTRPDIFAQPTNTSCFRGTNWRAAFFFFFQLEPVFNVWSHLFLCPFFFLSPLNLRFYILEI